MTLRGRKTHVEAASGTETLEATRIATESDAIQLSDEEAESLAELAWRTTRQRARGSGPSEADVEPSPLARRRASSQRSAAGHREASMTLRRRRAQVEGPRLTPRSKPRRRRAATRGCEDLRCSRARPRGARGGKKARQTTAAFVRAARRDRRLAMTSRSSYETDACATARDEIAENARVDRRRGGEARSGAQQARD